MRVRDMCYAMSRIYGMFFTHTSAAKKYDPDFYDYIIVCRAVANLEGLGFHCVAAFATGAELE
jgi:hypothetical protein